MRENDHNTLSILRPGAKAPVSGIYQNTYNGNEVTATRGERLPPTKEPGQGYRLVHRALHARPKRRLKVIPGQMVLLDEKSDVREEPQWRELAV